MSSQINERLFVSERQCRCCRSTVLKTVFDFGHMPLADRLIAIEKAADPEPVFPLTLALCTNCSLLQIRETVAPEFLFDEDYPYYSSFSTSWLDHCRENAQTLIERLQLDSNAYVVEIASNDGYLLKNFVEYNIPVLGIEPTPGPAQIARDQGIETLQSFFSNDLALELVQNGCRADVVLANNVLAHVNDPIDVVRGIRQLMKPDAEAVFEVPYVRDLVDKCQFDTIYHEHLCYFSVRSLQNLFEQVEMSIVDVQHLPTHGGSLRVFVKREGKSGPNVIKMLQAENNVGLFRESYYQSFADRIELIRTNLADLVDRLKRDNSSIAAYGAAAKGAMLLNLCGITNQQVDCAFDRNIHKQGRLMPGSRIPILDPSRILQARPDYLLLLPWNLESEIIEQQRDYLESGGIMIVPVPEIRFVPGK